MQFQWQRLALHDVCRLYHSLHSASVCSKRSCDGKKRKSWDLFMQTMHTYMHKHTEWLIPLYLLNAWENKHSPTRDHDRRWAAETWGRSQITYLNVISWFLSINTFLSLTWHHHCFIWTASVKHFHTTEKPEKWK